MKELLPAQEALNRLLAAIWDPKSLPSPDSIPWVEVIKLIGPSNIGAVVYAISRDMSASIPGDVEQILHEVFYRTIAANTRYIDQLKQVYATLSQTGSPLVLLKGASLAQKLYGDTNLRLLGDIDLLLPKEFVPASRDILINLGYSPAYIEHQPGSFLHLSNQEMFLPPLPTWSSVELHWHMLDIPYFLHHLPLEWFWQKTEALEIDQEIYRVLNPEANLIFLPAHLAFHHAFQGIHSYLDLALLIIKEQARIDWSKVIRAAHSFELLSVLGATLDRLSQRWPSLPIQETFQAIAAIQPSQQDVRLFHLLTADNRTTTLDFYTTLISLPNLSSRLRYAWINLFPQPAYMRKRYNIKNTLHYPYWYFYRLAGGLIRLVRMLPNAFKIQ